MSEIDPEALKILFKQQRSVGFGMKSKVSAITKDEYSYAKSKGVMFDAPILAHQGMIKRVLAALKAVDRKKVANAFVASLRSRRLDLRSALGSFAVFQHLPPHKDAVKKGDCPVCGEYISAPAKEDLNELNYERFKWGGLRHDSPIYAAFDLEQFKKATPSRPAPADIKLLKGVFAAIEESPPKTSASTLNKLLATSFISNKTERDVVIAILGFCGILETSRWPGYRLAFIRADDREERESDMPYPACWWKRSEGVREEAIDYWFGHLI